MDVAALLILEKMKEEIFGSFENRDISEQGSAPVEQREDGSVITCVGKKTRCYALGATYEKQTLLAAPNANCKVAKKGDRKDKVRRNLLTVCVSCLLS